MATLTLVYDTGSVPLSRIIDAMCVNFSYQVTIPDPNNEGQTMANPESKANFAKRMVRDFIVDIVKSQEVALARKTAGDAITPITLT